MKILNSMFIKFDKAAELNEVTKIKTIGDCYVSTSGVLTDEQSNGHVVKMVQMAISMHKAMQVC